MSYSEKKIKPSDIKNTKHIISKRGEHKKFIDNVVMMLSSNTLPYYAELATFINYYETTTLPTCGVSISRNGMDFYWNRKFIDSLDNKEALFLLLHEEFHLLFDHSKRSIIYNKKFSNMIQDMIINQIIYDELMSHEKTKDKISIPKHKDEFYKDEEGNPILDISGNPVPNPMYGKNSGLFIPIEYKGVHIFENLYEWLKEQHRDYKKRKGQQKEQEEKDKGETCSKCGQNKPDKDGEDGEEKSQNQNQNQNKNGKDGEEKNQNQNKDGEDVEDKSQDQNQNKNSKDQNSDENDGDTCSECGNKIGDGQPQPEQGDGQGDGQGQPQPEQGDGQGDEQGDGQGDGQGQPQLGQGQGNNGEPLDSFGKPSYGKNGHNGVDCTSMDALFDGFEKGDQMTLDSHLDDDVPENARKSIVGDFMQRLKNRGLVSGEVEKVLNKLRKSKYNYLKEIKRTISHHIFGDTKRKSITKPNRRGIEGLKGKKKYKNVINCILDTSGSMGGDFEHVLSYIFQNDIHINLVQIDTSVKVVEDIKNKRDLQKMRINGLGGTVLQPAIEYILNPVNKLDKFNTVILTDGHTDTLDFSNCKHKILILTTGKAPNYADPRGKVRAIVIDKKNSIHGD